MIKSGPDRHSAEVRAGRRFEFGKNWQRFLKTLSEKKIALAEQSLRESLNIDRLTGKLFLDVGSGSGLFSLAARRLGATVRSFDFDPHSVACTSELRSLYMPGDTQWTVEQGSILDQEFVGALGTYDIVYSWGVLHHTGSMWEALQNVKSLTKANGQLFIAIYNDQGTVSEEWRKVKQRYNQLPSLFRLPYALRIIARTDAPTALSYARQGQFLDYVRRWTAYAETARGMNKWYDWIDWIGGYPFEFATIEAIVDFFGKDGFELECLTSRAAGLGCNEFVFQRKAGLGEHVDNPLPTSRYLLRQCGVHLRRDIHYSDSGYTAAIPDALRGVSFQRLALFRDGKLVGTAEQAGDPDKLVVAPPDWPKEKVAAIQFDVARAEILPLPQDIRHYSGHMYGASIPGLSTSADNMSSTRDTSPVFVFENGRQLEYPHSIHDEIVKHGAGRFSHWGNDILFSSSDNSDPRSNGRTYQLAVAQEDDPPVSSRVRLLKP